MQCQKCKKRAATVHLTEIVKSQKREKHLCEKCAAEEGVTMKQHVPLSELLTSFLVNQAGVQELATLTCPECGLNFLEYRNQGLLGCPNDYQVFEKALQPLIERAHEGATHHVGKVPRKLDRGDSRRHQVMRLRRELEAAIQREEYERAAQIRDRIQSLESQ